MERVRLCDGAGISVFIDYAHTPDALENLLVTARGFKTSGNRIVLVFGCGGDRDRTKRPLMGGVASRLADLTVVTSDNSRSEDAEEIISDIVSGFSAGGEYKIVKDRRSAIEFVIKNAHSGDIILLAGKGHEKYEIDSSGKHDFDEKKIAAEIAEKYYGRH